jgi:hypothetical protein
LLPRGGRQRVEHQVRLQQPGAEVVLGARTALLLVQRIGGIVILVPGHYPVALTVTDIGQFQRHLQAAEHRQVQLLHIGEVAVGAPVEDLDRVDVAHVARVLGDIQDARHHGIHVDVHRESADALAGGAFRIGPRGVAEP